MPLPDLYAGFIDERTSGEGVIVRNLKASGDANFQNYKGTNVDTPTEGGDIANKSYVDNQASGSFTGLTDTPASYSGEGTKTVRVNAGETALEFATSAGDMTKAEYDTDDDGVVDAAEDLLPNADVNMLGKKLTGTASPTASGDVSNKKYVDENAASITHASQHWFGSGDVVDLDKLKPQADVDWNNHKINNLITPELSGDACNKKYADEISSIQNADENTKVDTASGDHVIVEVGGWAGRAIDVYDDGNVRFGKAIYGGGLDANKTVNLDNSMSAATIQALIDAQPKYIPYGKTLTFQFADGTYTLSAELVWEGFDGGGTVRIYGNASDNSLSTTKAVYLNFSGQACNGIVVYACSCKMDIHFLKIAVNSSGGWCYCLSAQHNIRVVAQYNYFLGNSTTNGAGVLVIMGKFYAYSNYFSDIQRAFYGSNDVEIMSYNNDDTGTQPAYGLYAAYNTTIGKRGTQPAGSTANELVSWGSVIR